MENTIEKTISAKLNLKEENVKNTIALIDEGNTIPFIARYRKEVTNNMDDETLRQLDKLLKYLRTLEERKIEVKKAIESQEKMTPKLQEAIDEAQTLSQLEDIYLPFKQNKKTKAQEAISRGLEPVAKIILAQKDSRQLDELAKYYSKENLTPQEVLDGAKEIISQYIFENANYKKYIKTIYYRTATFKIKAKDKEDEELKQLEKNLEKISNIPSHRYLALKRLEDEKKISIKIEKDEEKIIEYLKYKVLKEEGKYRDFLIDTINYSYKKSIEPAIDRQVRNEIFEKSQEQAISVFKENLKKLLLQKPVKNMVVLGLDPGFRTGCKVALIDGTGKLLDYTTIYPTEPKCEIEKSENILMKLIKKYDVNLISIGNGTASRQTENFVSNMISKNKLDVKYAIVSEAGASVYSASELATKEYPDIDVSIRGAISIARRLQDPLVELVKIDPKSIGVGQYQHEVDEKMLDESLTQIVEDCVNKVGVDLNTATPKLLEYIAGINPSTAKNIVKYREENGKFKTREELLKVKRLGKETYKQCIGFLRITDGENPLDNTGVHPENYKQCEQILKYLNVSVRDLKDKIKQIKEKLENIDIKEIAKQTNLGEYTIGDIIKELEKPGRDIRDAMPDTIFKNNILNIEDLKVGMKLKGVVRNVVDFGAFVDLGVKESGLIHISKMSKDFVKNPYDIVSVNDVVDVTIIDITNKKIALELN